MTDGHDGKCDFFRNLRAILHVRTYISWRKSQRASTGRGHFESTYVRAIDRQFRGKKVRAALNSHGERASERAKRCDATPRSRKRN